MFAAATMLSQRGAHLLRMPPGRKHQRRLQAQVAVVYCQYCQYCSGQHGQHSDYGPWAISLYKILYSAYSLAYRAMECCKKDMCATSSSGVLNVRQPTFGSQGSKLDSWSWLLLELPKSSLSVCHQSSSQQTQLSFRYFPH